jgi:hypothetical protein
MYNKYHFHPDTRDLLHHVDGDIRILVYAVFDKKEEVRRLPPLLQ